MKREKCVHCKYDRHIYRQKDIGTLISKEQLMVFIKDFLDSILDDQTSKQQELSIELFNQFFDYCLRYNRLGLGDKIKQMQKKLNTFEPYDPTKSAPADCPSCGQKNYSENSECDDCRRQV